MILLPVLACSLAALLFALILGSWLSSRKGKGEGIARKYAIVRGRISNFWSYQYWLLAAAVVIVAAGAGFGLGWKYAAVCAAGAAVSFITLIAGSGSYATGITAAYKEAADGDIRQSVRAGFRTGAVSGSLITGLCLLAMCGAVYFSETETAVKYAASFALGACLMSIILHTGGEVYSSAYSLAVPSRDFADRSGIFIGAGSDYASSYITSAAAAMVLSDIAVATSGVTSTFTADDALIFPLLVYASGIAGSVVGVFVHRAGIGNDPSKGADIGCIAAGIITVAGAVYFSLMLMQSRVYAYAVACGVVAGLILAELCRLFSPDSKLFLNSYKTDKGLGRYSSVIFNLGTGMVSTAISAIIIIVATGISYMFASYYGVALCAVGLCSIFGSGAAVTGLEVASGTVSEMLRTDITEDASETMTAAADILDTVSVRNGIMSKSYASIAGTLSTLAAFCALFIVSGDQQVDIMTLRVFCGFIAGVAAAFILAGIIIGSVRITGRVALRDIGRNDDETGATSALRGAVIPAVIAIALPVLIGLLVGAQALAGFIIASTAASYMIITCFNCSGMHFENTAVQSLSSLIRMMAVFSLAFLPVFISVGGILFR